MIKLTTSDYSLFNRFYVQVLNSCLRYHLRPDFIWSPERLKLIRIYTVTD